MPAIELDNITKRYGDVEALRDVTVDINEGELFALLGNNGAGKTTTVNIITGQTKPDSGTVSVLGEDPVSQPVAVRQNIGILPERQDPKSNLTPREYFHFVGVTRGVPDDTLERRIIEWASKLDFSGELDTLMADLSRGQQQMVMITQAFLSQPPIVIIDEPLVNLDPARQERVKEALLQYRNRGNTVVISTHRLPFVEDVCSRACILHEGEVQATVDISELETSLRQYYAEQTIPLPSVTNT